MECSTPLAEATLDDGAVISFKDTQTGANQFVFGDHNDVESLGDLVSTENLSNQSFSFVSLNGSAEFSRGRDPQPARKLGVRQEEHCAIPAAHSEAAVVDPLEFSATANSFVGAKIRHLEGATPSSIRRKQSDVCGPSRDAA
jgi:hypothetical protein